ncbi:MAG TPA: ribosome recycling factor [Chloroflexi bacterium]|jgi:ribosome recycling factor|nr:ribosome recycling factor [Chloroflexota bacterium]
MIDDVLLEIEERMEKAVGALRTDLMGIRTGRASPALVERIMVEAYGSTMPLNQTATIAVPEPRLLTIRPWDASIIGAIERAILKSDLGLTPSSDGKIIRLPIPTLTDERRRDLARMVNRRVEEGRVAVRNLRRDGLKELEALEKNKEISEDDLFRAKEDLQELTDQYVKKIDEIGEQKQAEIMEV